MCRVKSPFLALFLSLVLLRILARRASLTVWISSGGKTILERLDSKAKDRCVSLRSSSTGLSVDNLNWTRERGGGYEVPQTSESVLIYPSLFPVSHSC